MKANTETYQEHFSGDDADNIRYDAARKIVWVGYGQGALAALDLDGNRLFDVAVSGHRNRLRWSIGLTGSS